MGVLAGSTLGYGLQARFVTPKGAATMLAAFDKVFTKAYPKVSTFVYKYGSNALRLIKLKAAPLMDAIEGYNGVLTDEQMMEIFNLNKESRKKALTETE